jgi:uncharacterized coiled-coil protein SlyX
VVREEETVIRRSNTGAWIASGIIAVAIAFGLAGAYIYQNENNSKQLAARESDANATIAQMQSQIDTLTAKLDQAPAAAAVQTDATTPAPKRRSSVENKRMKEMQAKLDDQQQQLKDTQNQVKDTQDQVAQARTDLEASLSSTRDDFNGSIARTHDELVSLEQRGERSYFEFDLTKASRFHREGPIMVSLRKVDTKHKRYDLALVVDDALIKKSSVSIYEPVWLQGSDMQQVQLVVNKVDKDHVHGYVSAPKYTQTASLTQVSEHTSTTTSDTSNAPATVPATVPAVTPSDSSATTPSQQPE